MDPTRLSFTLSPLFDGTYTQIRLQGPVATVPQPREVRRLMALVWLLALPSKRCARRRQPEDARVMHDIHRGLARMENRLNSLETIMMDDETRAYTSR